MALSNFSGIPFPLSTTPGAAPQEGKGRLINCFAEPRGNKTSGDKETVVYHRSPGLVNFGTTTRSGCRGLADLSGTVYSAWNGYLESHSSGGGASTLVGLLAGSRKGFFARNNKSPTPDQCFVDIDGNIFTFTNSSVSAGWPDPDLPAVNSVCVIDGYFVFTTGDGRAFASDLNDTSVSSLSFTNVNAKPDGLLRAIPFSGQLFLFGNNTTEIWSDKGSIPFPFQRLTVIPRGLAGPLCVAGHEDGFGKALMWVGDDNRVHRLVGYDPQDVSPADLDRLIAAVSDKNTLEACVYIADGHAFWELSSETWTWVFDINSQKWHERQSYQSTRSRITSSTFTTAGKWLCGDTATGNIQQITSSARDEVGDPLRVRIESGPVENFANRIRVARADFEFSTGVGIATGDDPQQTNPDVEVSWSDDGGVRWSVPLLRKLGRQGEAATRVSVLNTGLSGPSGRRWRLDMSSAVHFGLMNGSMSAEARRQ